MNDSIREISLAVCLHGDNSVKDRCFTPGMAQHLGDDLDLPLIATSQALREHGIACHTIDYAPIEEFGGFVWFEMPPESDAILQYAKRSAKPRFLIVVENHFIWKGNDDVSRFGQFTAVFTYNDNLVGRGNVFKLNYARTFSLPDSGEIDFNRRKLACMISSLVKKNRPHLCSYMRLQAARFYEENHPESFDLYGPGWDNGTFLLQERPNVYKWLYAFRLNKLLPRRKYTHCWKGTINDRKRATIGRYKFSYCYENTVEIPGYITEKMFDVMMAGTVPIYLGHPSTSGYIHKDCYIDRADFKDDAELYAFISSMKEDDWHKYLDAARNFMAAAANGPFSISAYVKTLCDVIVPAMRGRDGGIT